MGIFDKAKEMAEDHKDELKDGIEKAGDAVDTMTDGKYATVVDMAQDKAGDAVDGL